MIIYAPSNFNLSINETNIVFKLAHCFISFVPITTFTLITSYLEINKNDIWYKSNLLIGTIFLILVIFTDLIVDGSYSFEFYQYPKAGLLHPLLVFHCLYLATLSIYFISQKLKSLNISIEEKNHLKYFLAAIITLSIGSIDFLANYNVIKFTFGYITCTIFVAILSLAIIKHKLLNIKIVLHKGVIYSLLISTITIIFLLSVFISESLLHQIIGYNSLPSSLFTASIVAIIFIPLKDFFQHFVEKTIFKGSYLEITEENVLLKKEIIRSERMKMVSTLASGLAHEIKNPLTPL